MFWHRIDSGYYKIQNILVLILIPIYIYNISICLKSLKSHTLVISPYYRNTYQSLDVTDKDSDN